MKNSIGKLLGVIFVVFFTLCATNSASAIGVTSTITVRQSPEGITYDSVKGEMFVANYGNNTVSVIAVSNKTVVATIPIPQSFSPFGIVYDSGVGKIYVSCSDSFGNGKVYVIDDDLNQLIANVTVGRYPFWAAYDSGKGEIFVSNTGGGTVSVIADNNNTVVATVGLGAQPKALCYDSGKGEIFVPCWEGGGPIKVISDTNNTVVATILCPEPESSREPWAVGYNPIRHEIFVSTANNTVFIISDTNNTIVASLQITSPTGFVYDSGKDLMFTANEYGDSVSVISDHTVIETIAVGSQPRAVAYVPTKGEVFVTNSYVNTVSVISDAASVPSQPGTGGQQPKKSTPGFELLIVIGATASVLLLKRKR